MITGVKDRAGRCCIAIERILCDKTRLGPDSILCGLCVLYKDTFQQSSYLDRAACSRNVLCLQYRLLRCESKYNDVVANQKNGFPGSDINLLSGIADLSRGMCANNIRKSEASLPSAFPLSSHPRRSI